MIDLQPVILEALRKRTIVEFGYRGSRVTAEPHEVGVTEDGEVLLAALKFEPTSEPAWQTYVYWEIQKATDTGVSFDGDRPSYDSRASGFMQIERRYQHLVPPKFDLLAIPSSEREAASLLMANLADLQRHVDNFLAAVELIEFGRHHFASNERQAISWMQLAGRDAIVSVRRFDEVRHQLTPACKNAPSLWTKVDRKLLGRAGSDFERNFPNWKDHRDAVVHSGTKFQALPGEKHSLSGEVDIGMFRLAGKSVHISDAIHASDTFFNSWKGKIYWQRVAYNELYKLDLVKLMLWRAYAPEAKLD